MKAKHNEQSGTLGPLQREVLDWLWEHPGATVRECRDWLEENGDKDYAYTTIQTVFDNLHKKKLVSRRRVKNAYRYQARQSRGGLLMERFRDLFSRFGAGAQPVASSLVDAMEENDPEELQALVEELKKRGHM